MFERAATGDGRAITLLLVVGGMLTASGRMGSPYLPRSAPIAQGIEQRFPKPCVAGSNPAGGAFPFLPGQRPVRSSAGRVGPPSGHARPSWGPRDLEKWPSSRSLTVSRSSSKGRIHVEGSWRRCGGEASAVHTGLTVAP